MTAVVITYVGHSRMKHKTLFK